MRGCWTRIRRQQRKKDYYILLFESKSTVDDYRQRSICISNGCGTYQHKISFESFFRLVKKVFIHVGTDFICKNEMSMNMTIILCIFHPQIIKYSKVLKPDGKTRHPHCKKNLEADPYLCDGAEDPSTCLTDLFVSWQPGGLICGIDTKVGITLQSFF